MAPHDGRIERTSAADAAPLLIIGAGRWYVPLFERARDLGYRVVASDLHSTAPAFRLANEWHVLDVRDVAGNLSLAKKVGARGVLTGVDLAVPTVARIASELRLPGISSESARLCTDKTAMRRRALEIGLDVPQSLQVGTVGEALDAARTIGLPVILKPVDNCGSRGVTVVERESELGHAFERALSNSFHGTALVEEFMPGREASVEGFVDSDGEFHILGIADKRKSELPYRFDLELRYPADFRPEQLAAIEAYAGKLVRGFGITMGLTHTELMVSGERVRLIETAARGCGGNVVGRLIPAATGLDAWGLYVQMAAGLRATVPPLRTRHALLKFVMLAEGRIRSIEGVEDVARSPGVVDFSLEASAGDRIEGRGTSTVDRMGHVIVVGDSRTEVDALSSAALARLFVDIDPRTGTQ